MKNLHKYADKNLFGKVKGLTSDLQFKFLLYTSQFCALLFSTIIDSCECACVRTHTHTPSVQDLLLRVNGLSRHQTSELFLILAQM